MPTSQSVVKTVPLLLMAAALLSGTAQDVNNPATTPLDRPRGPSSAPGVMVNVAPADSPVPTADPNAPLEGRATTAPRIVRPPPGERAKTGRAIRRRNVDVSSPSGDR